MKNYQLPTKIDLSRTILWQYSRAERLISLIQSLQESAEASTVDLWKLIGKVFDIRTPIGASDLHYRELGLNIITRLFGFEAPPRAEGMDDIPYLEFWRHYLLGQLYLIDSNGSVPEINQYLKIVLPETNIYVQECFQEGLPMTIRYVLPKEITPMEELMLSLLPLPAGVNTAEAVEALDKTFSFELYPTPESIPENIGNLDHAHFTTEE